MSTSKPTVYVFSRMELEFPMWLTLYLTAALTYSGQQGEEAMRA